MSCRCGRCYLLPPRRIESMPSGAATPTPCAGARGSARAPRADRRRRRRRRRPRCWCGAPRRAWRREERAGLEWPVRQHLWAKSVVHYESGLTRLIRVKVNP